MNPLTAISKTVAMTRADREAIWPSHFIYTGDFRKCTDCGHVGGHVGRCPRVAR